MHAPELIIPYFVALLGRKHDPKNARPLTSETARRLSQTSPVTDKMPSDEETRVAV